MSEDTSILGSNLTAVEAISTKLAEVTRLAEKLDARLCEAGARTRPMSITTAVTSSASSSLLSIPAVSSSVTPIRTVSIAAAPMSTSGATISAASVPVQVHPTSSDITTSVAVSSPLLATSATSPQKHHSQPMTSTHESAASTIAVAPTMSADVAKSVTSKTENLDESASRVLSHSMENVQTSNKDSSTKVD